MIRKNMKMKTFLVAAFTIILVLMGVLGVMSVYYTQQLASQTITFYEQPHIVQLNVSEIRRDMSEMNGLLQAALMERAPQNLATCTKETEALLKDMNERIQLVAERFSGDQTLLKNADQVVAEWVNTNRKITELMAQPNYEEASRVYEQEHVPLDQKLNKAVSIISEHAGTTTEQFYQSAKRSKTISVLVISLIVAGTCLFAIVTCVSIIRTVMVPLREIKQAADAMSKGNLHHTIAFEGKNEFGELADSMRHTSEELAGYVGNIDFILDRMSSNDLTVAVDIDYVGDFAPIKASLQQIIGSFKHTVTQMADSAAQVADVTVQVSSGAQVLSQGASEQASSVEELSASITEISGQVRQNASYTREMNHLVDHVGSELDRGNQQMQQMLGAMSNINHASDQIAKIIKTIEDIAFQTNILALNAAVEAARAGTAGKGFAVVADEVRSLAGKSAEAAKSTTALIQNSIEAVEHGTHIADGTAKALLTVVDGAQKITEMVQKIADSSDQQALSLGQVTDAVAQISQVVQTNSATAEESAAASEEMSSQAQLLKQLVRQFKLGNGDTATEWKQDRQQPIYAAQAAPSSYGGKY